MEEKTFKKLEQFDLNKKSRSALKDIFNNKGFQNMDDIDADDDYFEDGVQFEDYKVLFGNFFMRY